MTKSASVTVLITALVTSLGWYAGTSLRSSRDRMWLVSAVKVPGRMALDAIAEDMSHHRYIEAYRRIKLFRREWHAFDQDGGFNGNAIGNIMVEFSKLDIEAATNRSTNLVPRSPSKAQ